ncbi:MAG: hypothetical protein WAP51_04285 [Candidatus Sungiibacteriota bacterium]
MARPTMPLDEFMEKFLGEAFNVCGQRFHPVDAEKRQRNMHGMTTSLKGNVPKRFLHLLETSEDPKKIVEDTLEDISGAQNQYLLLSVPGKFTREGFLAEIALQTVSHIAFAVFGPSGEAGLKFTLDVASIYTFFKQKTEQAMADNGEANGGNGLDSVRINFREEEKKELIQKYANSLFSIHTFIKKVSSEEIRWGQYI